MTHDQALIDDFIVDNYRNVLLTYHDDCDNDCKLYEYTLELIKKYGVLFSKYINTLHCDNGNYLLEYITRNILCYGVSPQAKYVFNWCIRYANVNATNNYGCTVLHTASNFGDKYIIKKLISKGANVNIQNNDGETPLLEMTIMGTTLNDCVRIILKAGANPNTCNKKGFTPLHNAIRYDNVKCIKMLLKAGANVNIQNNDGETPLLELTNMGTANNDCVRIILKAGANPNTCNKKGFTPLHNAIRYDNVKCIKMLLKAGANPNTRNKKGITPLDDAISNCINYCNIKIIKLLLDMLMYT